MGFVQMTMAACVGIAVGHALAAGAQALAVAVALCSVLALLSYLALIRVRRAPGGPAV
jgi:DHA1 family bicyclomycin/chloramphenicol resistance-like MFS transporter